MSNLKSTAASKPWAGLSLLIIAGIHTAFGLLAGLRLIPDAQMQRLVGDAVPLLHLKPAGFGAEPTLAALTMFWFLFFGFALIPLATLLRHLEKKAEPIPRSIGYQLIALSLGGALFLPASGFWFALIPAWQILRKPKAAE